MMTKTSHNYRSHRVRRALAQLLVVCWIMVGVVRPVGAKETLDLQLLEIELPGPPVEVFASDLNGDGIGDLLILVAYTTWDQITISEEIESDEVEGLIEMMTIVPSLADRRELFFLRGSADGGFELVGEGLAVPKDVSTFMAGPSAAPVLAIDDTGLVAVRLESDEQTEGALAIRYQRLLELPTVLTGGGSLLPGLQLTGDVDQDGELDLIYPMPREYAIFSGSSPGFADSSQGVVDELNEPSPSQRLERAQTVYLPGREDLQLASRRLHYPLPNLDDLNGDGFPELVLLHPNRRFNDPWIAENKAGQFEPLRRPLQVEGQARESGIVFLGDLDDDGRAEYVREEPQVDEDAGFRDEMKTAKVPPYRYWIYDTSDAFGLQGEPQVFDSTGYAFGADSDAEFPLPGGFQDLDGDGRLDLVTITLDFTMMQLVRIMVTQSISIGLDFHIRCQQPDGTFKQVKGLDLSGKFKVRLNDLRIGQLSQFAGDFDGDGRADFVQMGRGKRASIHRGSSGCRYPAQPDLEIELEQEPKNLSLVRVDDYDGDGLADLVVVHPRKGRGRAAATAADASTLPVTLEMHLSRQKQSGRGR